MGSHRTWPFLAAAFGILVVLIALSGLGTLHRARQISAEIAQLHQNQLQSERILNEVRNEVHISGILVRDYLLDPNHLASANYREQLVALRGGLPNELDQLARFLPKDELPKLERLRHELDAYWDSLDPLFEWTPQQKIALSTIFLRRQVLPRRDSALAIAREIRTLNRANLDQQRLEIERRQHQLPAFAIRMVSITLALGLCVAAASILRITRLERRSEEQRRRTEEAENEMRRLSHQLVDAQESERRSLSRELHDQVGQMLTALRMELRGIQELRTAPEPEFQAHLEDAKKLAEQALRVVRDLAMGLRPSMLDDLGLGPTIQWQAREFSRRAGVPVTVELEGALDGLPDRHRTCVYRVIQEALTNCARHAEAKDIRIAVAGRPGRLSLTIRDDGVGFQAARGRGQGLGLIGMEERVNELGGRLKVASTPRKGTVLSVELPMEEN